MKDTSQKCDQQFIMNHQETQPKLECVDWCDASVFMKCVIFCDVMFFSCMFLSAATTPAVTVIGKQFRATTPAVTVIGN